MRAVKSQHDYMKLLVGIMDAFNRHDWDGVVSYFADDGIWLASRGPEPRTGRTLRGKQAIKEYLIARHKIFHNLQWVQDKNWVIGDKGLSEWLVQGTSADGQRIDWLGCDLWEFANGKVTKKDTYWKVIEPKQ
ncbi:MAG TPA: nuclear transport factor 2 family protein [bacterium]